MSERLFDGPASAPKRRRGAGHWRQVSAGQLAEFYLASGTANTRRAYRLDLEHFARFLKVEKLAEAVKAFCDLSMGSATITLGNYRQWLMESGAAANTTRRRISSVLGLAKKARECGVISWSVCVEMPPRKPARDTRGPSREKVLEMIALSVDRADGKGARDAAILELLLFSGLRSSELLSIDLEHLDLERLVVSVKAKARWNREEVKLALRTRDALRRWLEHRGEAPGPLFPAYTGRGRPTAERMTYGGLYALIAGLGNRVGIQCHPHGLRHTGITNALIYTNGNILRAMEFSRHKRPDTLLEYMDELRGKGASMVEIVADGRSVRG